MVRSMARRWVLLFGMGSVLALASSRGWGAAQSTVSHEFVPDVSEDEALVLSGPDGQQPAAIFYDGELLTAPQGGALRSDEAVLRAVPRSQAPSVDGQPSRKSPTFSPDRFTTVDGSLGYYAAFTPTIAPFKRVHALDTVVLAADGATPVLGVGRLETRSVSVVGAQAPPPDGRERDRFWGSVVLDFSGGELVPLPSVSPESRILTLRTEPQTAVRVEKDAADNFFVRLTGSRPVGPVRLVFLTDAPRVYFNGVIPAGPSDVFARRVAPLPAAVRKDALVFASDVLGLERGMPMTRVLEGLVRHFRSFEESDETLPTEGNIYADLARSMKGVCRHRTYAFVITAQAMGIDARFVMNEAHAWAEVRLPELGFMRVDLGGAARAFESHGTADRPVYRPYYPDPLPRPEPYARSYSQLRADNNVSGFRSDAESEAFISRDQGGPIGANTSAQALAQEGSAGASASADLLGTAEAERLPLRLRVDERSYEVFRGRRLEISGEVTTPRGEPVSGMRIEVFLRGTTERLLGITVSSADGRFFGSFGTPSDLPVGDYALVVRTPGDERYREATAL